MMFSRTVASPPEHLPWAGRIAPSVICTTNGALLTTFAIRGPDVDSLTDSALAARAEQLNHLFQRYGYGWCLHWDVQRHPATAYPTSDWPNAVTRLLDAERAALFADAGQHFTSAYYLTLVMQTPRESQQQLWRWLYERAGDQVQADYREIVQGFEGEAEVLGGLLSSLFVEVHRLDDDATMSYLHRCCSTKRHPVATPRAPVFLGHYLADEPLIGGEEPILGQQHLRVISVKTWPKGLWPGILHALDDLPLEYRLSLRWLPLDKSQALRETHRAQRRWLQKRKRLLTMLREEVMKRESAMIEPEADGGAADAVETQAAVAGGQIGLGYLTLHIMVWDADRARVSEKVELVERTLNGENFTTLVETRHAVNAWLDSMPGNLHGCLRTPLLSSNNLIDLAPTTAVWAGHSWTPHLNGPPLCYATTGSSTPFGLVLHDRDVGHTVIVGNTGTGKSALLSFLALQWQRYPGARVVCFDKGGSFRCATAAMQGAWYALGEDQHGLRCQPLARIDEPHERSWAASWLEEVLTNTYQPLTPADRDEVYRALTSLSTMPVAQRTLTALVTLLPQLALRQALLVPFTVAGDDAMLDGEDDTLAAHTWQCFEMETLLRKPRLVAPVLTYLFHKIEQQLTGGPCLLILDEAWTFLDNDLFAEQIREWLQTLRKKNVAVVFATPNMADIQQSRLAPIINNACQTRIFLANRRALEEEAGQAYTVWGLNERQRFLIAHAIPQKQYYYVGRDGQRVIDFQLGPIARALCGSGSLEDLAAIATMTHVSPATFAADWLRHKGLEWAATTLEHERNTPWEVHDALSLLPLVS